MTPTLCDTNGCLYQGEEDDVYARCSRCGLRRRARQALEARSGTVTITAEAFRGASPADRQAHAAELVATAIGDRVQWCGEPFCVLPSEHDGPHCDPKPVPDPIAAPAHYTRTPIEPRDVIATWDLNFALGNVVKYIARAGHKPGTSDLEDLRKAREYLDFEIARRDAR